MKVRLDKRMGVSNWRLHDLRRTCATEMAELGIQPHIVEAVLTDTAGAKAKVGRGLTIGQPTQRRRRQHGSAGLITWPDLLSVGRPRSYR